MSGGAEETARRRTRDVLEERARLLARPSAPAAPPGEEISVVKFGLGEESYAIEAGFVREAVKFTDFTPVPGAPDFLIGVMNLRGGILPVIDLKLFFGVAPKGLTDLSRILVLGRHGPEIGILADAAYEIAGVRVAQLREPATPVAGIGRKYLRGVTGAALVVIDGAALLGDERLYLNDRTGPA